MTGPSDEEIIRGIPDDLPHGVWVARAPSGEFVFANRAFQTIMGMVARTDVARGEYADPYGIHDRKGRLYPEDKLPFVQALREGREVVVDDIVIHRTDGRKVFIQAIARPIRDDAGTITHVLVAFQDITLQVRAEAARQEAEAQLARVQRMESMGNLAGGIAHDFNNLLTAIQGVAQILKLSEADPERQADLEIIDDAARRGTDLTRALLGFAGRGKNLSAAVSLREVASGLSDIARRTFGPDLRLITDLSHNAAVLGDAPQLERAILNLLLNARDALPRGGTVWFRTFDEGDEVVIEVEDDGDGVPDDIKARVFEPYFTTKTRAADRGTGLGLSTVFGIAESHRGSIDVLDGPSGGALFRLRVPATSAAPRPGTLGNRSLTPGQGRVLVVDDVAEVRSATSRSLTMAGYEVVQAVDGVDALEAHRREQGAITAVLLDLKMPRMDGATCFFELRKIDPDLKVVITTGSAFNEEVQRLIDAGAVGFVEKPSGIAKLTEVMHAAHAAKGARGVIG